MPELKQDIIQKPVGILQHPRDKRCNYAETPETNVIMKKILNQLLAQDVGIMGFSEPEGETPDRIEKLGGCPKHYTHNQ